MVGWMAQIQSQRSVGPGLEDTFQHIPQNTPQTHQSAVTNFGVCLKVYIGTFLCTH